MMNSDPSLRRIDPDSRGADGGAETGWVQRRRDHGNVIFIDLRDRQGLTQIVFNPEIAKTALDNAQVLRSEFVVAVKGQVVRASR